MFVAFCSRVCLCMHVCVVGIFASKIFMARPFLCDGVGNLVTFMKPLQSRASRCVRYAFHFIAKCYRFVSDKS